MAIYRTIQMSFWTDPKIVDDFTPEDRYFYLYLFTNPHTNLCGCYQISKSQMVMELGYSRETIEKLISRFEQIHKVMVYSEETKEILLVNWSKYNWTQSDKFQTALANEIQSVKHEPFKKFLTDKIKGIDTLSIPYPYPMDTSVTDTDTVYVTDTVICDDMIPVTEKEKEEANKHLKDRRNIIPPKKEWVEEYCKERGGIIDAENFCDFYESKNWFVGKSKMKDWQACVRTWEKNRKQESKEEVQRQTGYKQQQYDFNALEKFIKEN